ncbi:MAG: hypothetical protein ACRDDL_06240 [Sarcina sp.]
MIRTVVCEKEGCTGNSFHIDSKNHNVSVLCTNCGSDYEYDYNEDGFTLLSNCSSCNSERFKVFKDTKLEKIYIKCVKCGNPPEKVLVDSDGVQISFNEKLLLDIKQIVLGLDQKVMNLENKVQDLENGQSLSEVSLAYITKFLTDRD